MGRGLSSGDCWERGGPRANTDFCKTYFLIANEGKSETSVTFSASMGACTVSSACAAQPWAAGVLSTGSGGQLTGLQLFPSPAPVQGSRAPRPQQQRAPEGTFPLSQLSGRVAVAALKSVVNRSRPKRILLIFSDLFRRQQCSLFDLC